MKRNRISKPRRPVSRVAKPGAGLEVARYLNATKPKTGRYQIRFFDLRMLGYVGSGQQLSIPRTSSTPARLVELIEQDSGHPAPFCGLMLDTKSIFVQVLPIHFDALVERLGGSAAPTPEPAFSSTQGGDLV